MFYEVSALLNYKEFKISGVYWMRIFYITALFCILPLAVGAEDWDVDANPALMSRVISGFTEPSAFLDIKAENPGRLQKLHFEEGQVLEGGSSKVLIAGQDSTFASLDVKAAKAAVHSQKKQLEKRNSELAVQERSVAYRLLEFNRLSKLVKEGKIARSAYDQAQFEYESARLGMEDLKSAIAVQKQAIEESEILLSKAEETLSRFSLYGPGGWVVNRRYVEEGSWINSGDSICQLVDLRELSLFFRLSSAEVRVLKQGNIKLFNKENGSEVKARVHHIDLNFDPVSRKQLVELRLPSNQFNSPSGGIEIELTLNLPYPRPAVLIPDSYILRKLEQDYVLLKDGSEIVLKPLRRLKNHVIVERSDLPVKALLKQVKNK